MKSIEVLNCIGFSKHPLKAKKVKWCLSESTVVVCFLCLKFGLDFSLDPKEQGTPGSSLRFEMPFDELDVSPVAPDAERGPVPWSC